MSDLTSLERRVLRETLEHPPLDVPPVPSELSEDGWLLVWHTASRRAEHRDVLALEDLAVWRRWLSDGGVAERLGGPSPEQVASITALQPLAGEWLHAFRNEAARLIAAKYPGDDLVGFIRRGAALLVRMLRELQPRHADFLLAFAALAYLWRLSRRPPLLWRADEVDELARDRRDERCVARMLARKTREAVFCLHCGQVARRTTEGWGTDSYHCDGCGGGLLAEWNELSPLFESADGA